MGSTLGGIDELAVLFAELFIGAEHVAAGVGECFHYRIFIAAKIGKTFRIRAVKDDFVILRKAEDLFFEGKVTM